MMEAHLSILAAFLVLGVVTLVWYKTMQSKPSLPLPPGPPRTLSGDHFPQNLAMHYYKAGLQYGPITTLWEGPVPHIVINGYEEAIEIMDKQAAFLSNRPFSFVGRYLSGDSRTLFLHYGERWRKFRKALHLRLQPKMAEVFKPIQTKAAHKFVLDIAADPGHFEDHGKSYSSSIVMTMAYGKTTLTSYYDPAVVKVTHCFSRMGAATAPGQYLVESYPILQYVPFYTRKLWKWHQEELELFASQLDDAKARVRTGEASDCMASVLIENDKELALNRTEQAYLAGSLFGAGTMTTYRAISNWVMAAVVCPEAQAQVQEELDRVVGRSRLPTFEDLPQLPKLQAFYLESYRWRPVNPEGTPHAASQDIIYKGHLIPKGATVVGNHLGIHRDPRVYTDPDTFDLHRWLKDGQVRRDLRHFQYGFGRRTCPAMKVADQSVYITLACTLWTFWLSAKKDENGNDIPIDPLEFADEAALAPVAFPALFQERFPGALETFTALVAEEDGTI